MGIRFSHWDAAWSYSGFHEFRKRLAAAIKIDLEQMHGFAPTPGEEPRPFANQPWSEIDDPIKLLLDHSDCDGELTPAACRWVAPRLRELARPWPADDSDAGYDRRMALALAEGMERAAWRDESLEFR